MHIQIQIRAYTKTYQHNTQINTFTHIYIYKKHINTYIYFKNKYIHTHTHIKFSYIHIYMHIRTDSYIHT